MIPKTTMPKDSEIWEKIPNIASLDQNSFCCKITIRVANRPPITTKPKLIPSPVTRPKATPKRAL